MCLLTGARSTDIFGPAEEGPVFLSEVECTGTETNITECPSVGWMHHSCSHVNSTGVICGAGNYIIIRTFCVEKYFIEILHSMALFVIFYYYKLCIAPEPSQL